MSSLRRMLIAKAASGGGLSQEVLQYAASFGNNVVNDLKNYCNEHKALIPYVNDWKYIIHSLVETGKTSFLKASGNAYINTLIIPELNSDVSTVVYVSSLTGTKVAFGCRRNASDKSAYNVFAINDYLRLDYASRDSNVRYPIERDTKYDIYIRTGHCEINGDVAYDNTVVAASVAYTMCLFCLNQATGVSNFFNESIGRFEYKGLILVPYCKNGEYGMLDLNTCTFYGNSNSVGSFTHWLL